VIVEKTGKEEEEKADQKIREPPSQKINKS
jgi:hypothetical protein